MVPKSIEQLMEVAVTLDSEALELCGVIGDWCEEQGLVGLGAAWHSFVIDHDLQFFAESDLVTRESWRVAMLKDLSAAEESASATWRPWFWNVQTA